MERKSLAEVELREATFPLNRSAPSNFLPALRTASQLRELATLGVLDQALSQVVILAGKVGGCCLVERVPSGGFLSALTCEPLAQQRGGGRVLLDAVITAARAAKLGQLTIEVSEADAAQESLLSSAGFARQHTLYRMALAQPPNRSLLPTEATAISIDDAVTFLKTAPTWHPAPSVEGEVLRKLAPRLTALALVSDGQSRAALVLDKERKLILTLAGEAAALASLVVFAAVHHGVAFVDSLRSEDPAVDALQAAGFVRLSIRTAFSLLLGTP